MTGRLVPVDHDGPGQRAEVKCSRCGWHGGLVPSGEGFVCRRGCAVIVDEHVGLELEDLER